ncbi:MAG: hypothetical protein M3P96_11725 [Actinomycetota bacterium]|nr:hypothetical protein [Actinomycetota bacterium]
MDAWVTDGRVTRVTLATEDVISPKEEPDLLHGDTQKVSVELSGFGSPVRIDAPPPGSVMSVDDIDKYELEAEEEPPGRR